MIYKFDPGDEFEFTKNGEYRIQVGDHEPVVLKVNVTTEAFPFPQPEFLYPGGFDG